MINRLVLALAIVVTVLAIPPAAHAQTSRDFREVPCTTFAGEGVAAAIPFPTGTLCGFLTVPARHAEPNGPTIELAVVRIPALGTAEPDPLILAQGGPGGSTIDSFRQLFALEPLQSIHQTRDIIMLEQRGTKFSQPFLDCPEFRTLTEETLEIRLTREEIAARSLDAAAACRNRLAQQYDLSVFNSAENAADVAATVSALGYQQANLYGVSYGSLLALQTLRDHSNVLRSVIIDAVEPPQGGFAQDVPRSMDRAFGELFAACAADATCNGAYPNLEQTFFQVLRDLDANPARVPITNPDTGRVYNAVLDGDGLLNLTFQLMYVSDLIPQLPDMIYAARAGDFSRYALFWPLFAFDDSVAYGMYFSVACAEDADFTPSAADFAGVRPDIAERLQRNGTDFVATCQRWQVPEIGPRFDEPVRSDVPTLILNGRFDPITPPERGTEAAQTLSRSYNFTFPTVGHGAFQSSDCANTMIVAFLNSPEREPNASCIATEQVEFVTRGNVVPTTAFGTILQELVQERYTTLLLLAAGILILASVLLIWPLIWLIGKFTGRRTPERLTGKAAPWLAGLAALLALLLLFGIGVLVARIAGGELSEIQLYAGVPREQGWILLVPPLIALAALGMLAAAVLAWVQRIWHPALRVYYSFLVVGAGVLVFALYRTGLLGAFTGFF